MRMIRGREGGNMRGFTPSFRIKQYFVYPWLQKANLLGSPTLFWKTTWNSSNTNRQICHKRVGCKTHPLNWSHRRAKRFHYSQKLIIESLQELRSENSAPKPSKAADARKWAHRNRKRQWGVVVIYPRPLTSSGARPRERDGIGWNEGGRPTPPSHPIPVGLCACLVPGPALATSDLQNSGCWGPAVFFQGLGPRQADPWVRPCTLRHVCLSDPSILQTPPHP